jgi:hypothetical protein
MTDPQRIDEAIEDIEPEIEWEYGKPYGKLTEPEKEEVINNHFFIRNPNVRRSHPQASRELRITLDAYRGGEISGRDVRVTTIHRSGRSYRVIRDAKTGRIRQWVR